MKKNRILSFLSAGVLLLTGACSNEILDQGKGNDQKDIDPSDGVFMAVNFDLPTAKETRSYTDSINHSNNGTEIGKDYENVVGSVAVVLTSHTNEFIAYSESETIDPVGTTGRSYRTTNKFEKTNLGKYYGKIVNDDTPTDNNGNPAINVYVFCNPTQSLLDSLKNKQDKPQWFDITGKWVEEDGEIEGSNDVIWKNKYFLMSNSSVAVRYIPASIDDWDAFSSESSPFNLSGVNNFGRPNEVDNLTKAGNIEVERTAARYDFRDGALDGKDNEDETYNGFEAQTYHVLLDSDKNPLVDVYLGKMSIVNMNKSYNYLRRVSDNGLPYSATNNWKLCGPELPWYRNANGGYLDQKGNYVVDAKAEWKWNGGVDAPTTGFTNNLNFPFFAEDGVSYSDKWKTYLISKVLAGTEEDTPENWNVGRPYGTYKIWRYLTEGTIPGVDLQQEGISNGIVFKGQMRAARKAESEKDVYTEKLLEALQPIEDPEGDVAKNRHLLFEYGGHLYCGWEHIRRMALQLALLEVKEENGEYQFSFNRSIGIYNSVYGIKISDTDESETGGFNTGGFGEVTYKIVTGEGGKITADFMIDPEDNGADVHTLKDTMAPVEGSPNSLFPDWNHGEYTSVEYIAFRDAVVKNNIKIHQETYDKELGGWAYYCYYFYWNRHNDNGQNGVMGPMEFDVVRNNVYKLAVTKIARLGHPNLIENDPDAPTPNTPDEKGDVYITVTCTTLPWVVRLNEIQF